jgi:hypothetical protein
MDRYRERWTLNEGILLLMAVYALGVGVYRHTCTRQGVQDRLSMVRQMGAMAYLGVAQEWPRTNHE